VTNGVRVTPLSDGLPTEDKCGKRSSKPNCVQPKIIGKTENWGKCSRLVKLKSIKNKSRKTRPAFISLGTERMSETKRSLDIGNWCFKSKTGPSENIERVFNDLTPC
jgi:hypothetical protein